MSNERRPLVGTFYGVDNHITDADDAFVSMLGYTRSEFAETRKNLAPLSPPESNTLDEAAMAYARASGGLAPPYEKVFLHRDGSKVQVLVVAAFMPGSDNRWMAHAVDLSRPDAGDGSDGDGNDGPTQQLFWRLLTELISERTRTQAMLDGSTSLIWALGRNLELLSANSAALGVVRLITGLDVVVGQSLTPEDVPGLVYDTWRAHFERALGGESFRLRDHLKAGDLDVVFECRFSPILDPVGDVVGVTVVATDVSEAVATERRLEESESRFRTLFENMSDMAVLIDEEFRIAAVTPSIRDVLGYEGSEAIGRELWTVFGADEISPTTDEVVALLDTPGQRVHASGRVRDAQGRYRWLDLTLVNLLDDPAVGSYAASLRDITVEKENLERLQAQDALLRIASHLGRIAGWAVELPDRRVVFSEEMSNILGVDGIMAPTSLEVALSSYMEASRPKVAAAIERCLSDGTPFDLEATVELAGQQQRLLRVAGEARRDETGQIIGVHGAISDMTSLKAIEAQVRRQAFVLDAATFGISIQDLGGTIVYVNRAFEQLYGYTSEEAVGRHISELVGEADLVKFAQVSTALLGSGSWTGRVMNSHRTGRRFPIELHATVIPDDAGEPSLVMSVAAEITDRVELEERLALSQRLDSLGQLTGGIAHDFNNLLTVILGGAEMLADALGDDPKLSSLARMLLSAAEQGADLTNRLLAFARRQALHPEVVDPKFVVTSTIDLVRRSLPESVTITLDLDESVWPVKVDPAQLGAAIMNVCINARDAMADGGTLSVHLGNALHEVEEVAGEPSVPGVLGDYVCLEISDTGVGMPADVIERAFDPFYSTKDAGRGTGLGLSMVYGFVQQSEGHVRIDSEVGEGTSIRLYLPRSHDWTSGTLRPDGVEPPVGGTERVLLVEDEEMVRRHASHVLRELGYDVVEAGDGPEALAVIDSGEPFDLLFTDIVMPSGINGVELARRALRERPGLRVLYTSGYTDDAVAPGNLDGPLLRKPYRRETLALRVRHTLDNPGQVP